MDELDELLERDDMPAWVNTEMECYLCGKKWVACHPYFVEELECPKCHNMITRIN